MGHTRVGRLPRTVRWIAVLDALEDMGVPTADVSDSTLWAAHASLRRNPFDLAATECFDLIIHLSSAARYDRLLSAAGERGIQLDEETSARAFVAACSHHLSDRFSEANCSYLSSNIASRAFTEVLTKQLAARTGTLFGSDMETVRGELRALYAGEAFGRFARDFYAVLLRRTLLYFLSKEIPNHVGPDKRFEGVMAAVEFEDELERYSYERARIVQEFAGDWYGRRLRGAPPSLQEIRSFTGYGLSKLAAELSVEGEGS